MTNSPIPIAIVGLGFGRNIIRHLLQPENRTHFKIAALCDLDNEKSERMAMEIGARAVTFADILSDPNIPVVGLFTGPEGRANLVRQIIRAGKDVMTTKPFERDPTMALDVLKEAVRRGRIVHLNSPAPDLPPDLAWIRSSQERYHLGNPIAAQFSTWVRYREQPDGRWQDDPELCPVAPIYRIGIYLVNDAIELFGEPDAVQVLSSRLFTERPTADHAQLGIRFKNGGLVSIFASFCVDDGDPYRNSLTLNFETGTIYRNVSPAGNNGRAGHLSLIQGDTGKPKLIEESDFSEISGHYQWDAFYHAIQARTLTPPDYPNKVAMGLRVIAAMSESEKCGHSIIVKTT